MLMKTQDTDYILLKLQSERKVVQYTQFLSFVYAKIVNVGLTCEYLDFLCV